ncbi:MAG: prepilin peptidase [Verrucomicrobiota bacterium]
MNPEVYFHPAILAMVFVTGTVIGSFLNVCIYRLPRNLSVNNPKRSFCPTCQYQFPIWLNIPILSWLLLGGKCAKCKSAISPRYLLVEALTGGLFLWVWHRQEDWALAMAFWVFVSLLVVATFVDAEHYIIPDSTSLGGIVAGLIFSVAIPGFLGGESRGGALAASAMGAAVGFGTLFAVSELGKLAFGRKKFAFDAAKPWKVEERDEEIFLFLEDEEHPWNEFFYRKKDRLLIDCASFSVDGKKRGAGELVIYSDRFLFGGKETSLETVTQLSGRTKGITIPREAMGFGDVKLLAMIGAFLGWEGALFSILGGSVGGLLGTILARLVGRQEWAAKLPFGPWLAFGALFWFFAGPEVVAWYVGTLNR